MKNRINLLEGNIFTSLTKLAIPIMATSLIQMAYNMTDMIWIGRVGSDAVAAVGSAGMFMWLSQGFITLCRAGGQVKVGQSLGSKDIKEATAYARNAIQMCIVLAILYSITMIAFSKQFIDFFRFDNPKVVQDARDYLIYVSFGLIFGFLNQVVTGLITATGNSKTPFRANSVGLIANIVLDPLFIFGLGPIPAMGVRGAAIATVIAQAVVFALYYSYMKHDELFIDLKLFSKPEFNRIKQIFKIGFPPAAQSCMFTLIAMYISRVVASFGAAAVAVQKVGSQIESISWMTADGFAAALNSFIAQNYGAKNLDRTEKGYATALKISIVLGIITTSILVFLPGPIFYLFIPEKDILPLGIDYLIILGYSQLFMCVDIVTGGAFAGFGKTVLPSTVNIIFTALRIPIALFLVKVMGLNGIWWALTITSIIRGILIPTMFMLLQNKIKKKEIINNYE